MMIIMTVISMKPFESSQASLDDSIQQSPNFNPFLTSTLQQTQLDVETNASMESASSSFLSSSLNISDSAVSLPSTPSTCYSSILPSHPLRLPSLIPDHTLYASSERGPGVIHQSFWAYRATPPM